MDLRPTSTLKKVGRKRGNYEYRGIRFRGERWISEIRVPGEPKRIWLGSHLSAERAARAYDAALYCLRREEGNFNFPNNRRPDLTNKPIGSLTYDEIQSIAMQFSLLGESVETPALSPPREVPQLVESALIPTWEMSNQLCENKVDIPEEPYIPTFAPEEAPYDPAFVPDGECLAEQFLQLDQWMVFDEDWMRNSMNACP